MAFYSPLRYPGGKAKVANFVQCLIYENSLHGGVYVEPFVGGGSVALSLLLNGTVSNIYINDKDLSIYAFWHSVINDCENLCKLIIDTPVNVENWHKLKALQSDKENIDLLSLGFSTFFLNRTNRSGILKGGIIGGYEQKGKYKIDARFNKKNLIHRIQRIANYTEKIHLTNEDATIIIPKLARFLPNNTLFYLDPPYYKKGKGLYMNYFDEKDHKDIANTIQGITSQKWIVTYDNVPFITELYSNFKQKFFELNYSASNSGKGKEVMIFCDELIIPNHTLFTI